MGNRANVFMKDSYTKDKGVFFYTHWSGDNLPSVVQLALAKEWRWDDESYLARIVFCEMVKGYEEEETGYGISATVGDGYWRAIQIDSKSQTVTFGKGEGDHFVPTGSLYSFQEYVKLADPQWPPECKYS